MKVEYWQTSASVFLRLSLSGDSTPSHAVHLLCLWGRHSECSVSLSAHVYVVVVGMYILADWIPFYCSPISWPGESMRALISLYMSNLCGLIEFILLSVAGHAWLCCICGQRPSESERYVLKSFSFRLTAWRSSLLLLLLLLLLQFNGSHAQVPKNGSLAPPTKFWPNSPRCYFHLHVRHLAGTCNVRRHTKKSLQPML